MTTWRHTRKNAKGKNLDSTCIEIVQLARVVQGVAAGGGSRGKGGQSVLLFASPGVSQFGEKPGGLGFGV